MVRASLKRLCQLKSDAKDFETALLAFQLNIQRENYSLKVLLERQARGGSLT